MMIKTEYSFKKLTIFSITVFGMCFWASDSIAQSEREKPEVENLKPIEKPLVENQSDRFDAQIRENQIPSATTIISSKTTPPKKDTTLSGEGKKSETAPSTLSFNIFLYIVDKFKAD